jgi:hypothetical protein
MSVVLKHQHGIGSLRDDEVLVAIAVPIAMRDPGAWEFIRGERSGDEMPVTILGPGDDQVAVGIDIGLWRWIEDRLGDRDRCGRRDRTGEEWR